MTIGLGTPRPPASGGMRGRFGLGTLWRNFRLKVPERLLIAPQEIETGDPTVARDIYAGSYTLAGRTVLTRGQSPFSVEAPHPAWLRELHSFAWLRHFNESEEPVIRVHARALVDDWLLNPTLAQRPAAQRSDVLAHRMTAFLVNAPLLLTGADHDFYVRFMRALAGQAKALERAAERDRDWIARAEAAIAFGLYALCALTPERTLKRAVRLLERSLSMVQAGDGGPVDRNPNSALVLLAMLLPLRTAFSARNNRPPPVLETTIDGLLRFLMFLRHPGNDIALFNGMSASQLTVIGSLIQFLDSTSESFPVTGMCGYHRLAVGRSVVLVDAGPCPPSGMTARFHAGATSFELSSGHERIVVNCGAAPAGLAGMREALRETAAHSTLDLEGISRLSFSDALTADGEAERRASARQRAPAVERRVEADGDSVDMTDRCYEATHGLVHRRQLTLTAEGSYLSGRDSLIGLSAGGGVRATARLRFHLHPQVRAFLSGDGRAVEIQLASGESWTFSAGGRSLALEDSIFFGGLASQRRCQQITVALDGNEPEVVWSFARRSGGRLVMS
ncbi:MAG TPA: heparinase II/III family protein [Beijerinckiaceae bacterium]|nr:heparinase II/III family protein [Beijerinckiaceae bacterium]